MPDHLKMTFRVVGEKNQTLREGKDLAACLQLKKKVQETLSAVADDGLEQVTCMSGALANCRRFTSRSAAAIR